MNQEQAEIIQSTIYTKEKVKIWNKEMAKIGTKFTNDEISFTEFMALRRTLRKKLGFPA